MRSLKRLVCLAALAFLTQPLWAAPAAAVDDDSMDSAKPAAPTVVSPAATPESDGMLITISASPLIGVPVSGNTAKEYNVGGGGEIYISYPLEKRFFVGLETGVQDYTVNTAYFAKIFQQTYGIPLPAGVTVTGDFSYVPLLAMAKYYFHENGLGPYLLVGLGVALNSATSSVSYNNQTASVSAQESDFVMVEGLGVNFRLGNDAEIFLQARLDMDFTTSNNTDNITINSPGAPISAKGNLSDDSPTLFLPIQLGVRFL